MPIYEYECKACGRVDEVMQKVDAEAPESCSACAKGPLVKLMSRTGFILKGGGWYVTDFRGGGNKPAGGAPSGASDSGESKSGDAGSGSSADASPSAPSGGSGTGSGGSTENKASGGHGGGCHGGKCAM